MKNTSILLFVGLLLQVFVGCKSRETPAPASGLVGAWRLTSRQCYCAPTPVPNETITFTATQFVFYNSSRAMSSGDYSLTTAPVPCISNGSVAPALHFTYAVPNNLAPAAIQYRLDGNKLTLDYGGPCDAPVDTYERLQ